MQEDSRDIKVIKGFKAIRGQGDFKDIKVSLEVVLKVCKGLLVYKAWQGRQEATALKDLRVCKDHKGLKV